MALEIVCIQLLGTDKCDKCIHTGEESISAEDEQSNDESDDHSYDDPDEDPDDKPEDSSDHGCDEEHDKDPVDEPGDNWPNDNTDKDSDDEHDNDPDSEPDKDPVDEPDDISDNGPDDNTDKDSDDEHDNDSDSEPDNEPKNDPVDEPDDNSDNGPDDNTDKDSDDEHDNDSDSGPDNDPDDETDNSSNDESEESDNDQPEANPKAQELNPNWPTPKREAYGLCIKIKAIPTASTLRSILPYTATMTAVAKASSKVKKDLFKDRNLQRLRVAAPVCKLIKMGRKMKEAPEKTKRTEETEAKYQRVASFLCNPNNSVQFPSKRDHINGQVLYGLTHSMDSLFQKYLIHQRLIHEELVSRTTFFRARPKCVRTIEFTERRQCLSKDCANIALVCSVVPGLPKSPRDVPNLADEDITQCIQDIRSEPVKLRQWRKCVVMSKGRVFKKTKLVDLTMKKDEISDLLGGTNIEKFRNHCARISTQNQAVELLRNTLQPHREAAVQMDYSENWSAKYPDEISGVYYDKAQTTLHPMVVHYHDGEKLKHKSYVRVSSVSQHTVPTIYSFIFKLMVDLTQILPDLEIIHFITDGPSSQYRNRTVVALVSEFERLHRIRATWTWLEAGHGKGPCDGIGGGLKRKLDNLGKGGHIIRGIDELIQLNSTPINMTLLPVTSEDVDERRLQIEAWVKPPIHGLMKKHACIAVPGGVVVRDISCFAPCCRESPTWLGWKKFNIAVRGDMPQSSSPDSSSSSEESSRSKSSSEESSRSKSSSEESSRSKSSSEESSRSKSSSEESSRSKSSSEESSRSKSSSEESSSSESSSEESSSSESSSESDSINNDAVPLATCSNDDGSSAEDDNMPLSELRCKLRQERHTDMITIGDYVTVAYDEKWYPTKVFKVEGPVLHIRFMKPYRGKWVWSSKADEGTVKTHNILTRIQKPTTISGGKVHDVTQAERKEVEEKLGVLLN